MNHTKALFDLLGWQGGTIHQVAEVIEVDAHSLIYGQVDAAHGCKGYDCDFCRGQYAYNNCQQSWIRERLLPEYKGNENFWFGYMRAAYLASI